MTTPRAPDTTPASASPTSLRVIGPPGALAIVTGSMLGIGIFLTPSRVATHLPSPGLYLLAWVAGGFIALAGAVAYAELGTRFPEAGGDYVFLQEAFGPSLSFAAGWLLFVGVFTGSVATMAVPLAQYQLPGLLQPLYPYRPEAELWSLGMLELSAARAAALILIVGLTVLNVLGTRLSTRAQVLLTVLPFALLGIGAAAAVFTSPPGPVQLAQPPAAPTGVRFARAVLAVYFAYAGWNAIAYVGGEVKRPARTMPISLLGGTVVITGLYLVLAGCALYVLGIDALQQAGEVGTATARAIGGKALTYPTTLLIALVLVGSLNATVLAGGRVGLAMARRGALLAKVGALHPSFRTPYVALALQAALASLLVLTGTFEMLLELTSLAMFLLAALTVIALFIIRRRDGPAAPYQATGYPWLPGIFVLVSTAVITSSVYRGFFGAGRLASESLYPLAGLAVFVVLWLGHGWFRGVSRERQRH